jgi:hypothetical protein
MRTFCTKTFEQLSSLFNYFIITVVKSKIILVKRNIRVWVDPKSDVSYTEVRVFESTKISKIYIESNCHLSV